MEAAAPWIPKGFNVFFGAERSKLKSSFCSQGRKCRGCGYSDHLPHQRAKECFSVEGDGMAPAWTECFNLLRSIKRLSDSYKI